MHQVKKGNSWHFGIKIHIGVDDALGLIHSIATTSATTSRGGLVYGNAPWHTTFIGEEQ